MGMIIRKHRSVAVDPRGKIKSGKKSDRGLPMALDHFNIAAFPELVELYGDKPRAMIVIAPSNNIRDMYSEDYALYGGRTESSDGTKLRSCDGQICTHRVTETVEGKTYQAGELTPCICDALPEKHKQRCRYNSYPKFWVANPQTMRIVSNQCYLFETHSENSGSAIVSTLEQIRFITKGWLLLVPFAIAVKMAQGKRNAREKFPIWTFTCTIPTVEGLLKHVERVRAAFETAGMDVTQIADVGLKPQLPAGDLQ